MRRCRSRSIAAVEPGHGSGTARDTTARPLAELLAAHGLVVAANGWAVVPPAVRQAVTYLVPAAPGADGLGPAERGAGRRRRRTGRAGAPIASSPTALGWWEPRRARSRRAPWPRSPPWPPRWADEQGAGAEAVALGERSVDLHSRAAGADDAATRRARRLLAELYQREGDPGRAAGRCWSGSCKLAQASPEAGGKGADDRLAVGRLHGRAGPAGGRSGRPRPGRRPGR